MKHTENSAPWSNKRQLQKYDHIEEDHTATDDDTPADDDAKPRKIVKLSPETACYFLVEYDASDDLSENPNIVDTGLDPAMLAGVMQSAMYRLILHYYADLRGESVEETMADAETAEQAWDCAVQKTVYMHESVLRDVVDDHVKTHIHKSEY